VHSDRHNKRIVWQIPDKSKTLPPDNTHLACASRRACQASAELAVEANHCPEHQQALGNLGVDATIRVQNTGAVTADCSIADWNRLHAGHIAIEVKMEIGCLRLRPA
jgi:hypothetical protein